VVEWMKWGKDGMVEYWNTERMEFHYSGFLLKQIFGLFEKALA